MTAATRRQLTPEERARSAAVISLQKAGITDENDQRHICAVWARRPIRSRSELTEDEARSLARRVKKMTREELAAVLARPAPVTVDQVEDAMNELAAELTDPAHETMTPQELRDAEAQDAIVCGGEPADDDAAVLAAFAAELAELDPAPSPEEQPEPGHDLAACTEHPDCRRAATFYDVEPPPADVEQAAEDAVRRFRERAAAGIVPQAPDLLSIPPRVPVVLPPRADRYCLAVCWCGTCAHWTPAPPVDYAKTPGSKDHERIHGKWR